MCATRSIKWQGLLFLLFETSPSSGCRVERQPNVCRGDGWRVRIVTSTGWPLFVKVPGVLTPAAAKTGEPRKTEVPAMLTYVCQTKSLLSTGSALPFDH
jgi:hypothetical protein